MDTIDRKIISLLMEDGRLALRELGEAVHLSPNAVASRVRRLQDAGVLRGCHAQVDLGALGLNLEALVSVKLQTGVTADHFESMLRTLPGIGEVMLTTGEFDYVLRVACRDQADFVRLMESLRARGGVAATDSRIILRRRAFPLDLPERV